jgi:hypothetical protein
MSNVSAAKVREAGRLTTAQQANAQSILTVREAFRK